MLTQLIHTLASIYSGPKVYLLGKKSLKGKLLIETSGLSSKTKKNKTPRRKLRFFFNKANKVSRDFLIRVFNYEDSCET